MTYLLGYYYVKSTHLGSRNPFDKWNKYEHETLLDDTDFSPEKAEFWLYHVLAVAVGGHLASQGLSFLNHGTQAITFLPRIPRARCAVG